MKKTKSILMLLALAFAISCKEDSQASSNTPDSQNTPGTSLSSETALTLTSDTNQQENEDLLFMWEEEKMARDVYQKMFEKYGKSIFSNIKQSESKHMDAVKKLLDQRKLPTPVDGNIVGIFKNEQIAQMYKELIAEGNLSVNDAYQVGLKIEITDIEDLSKRILNTQDPAIITVYKSLLSGSINHKAAFEKNL